VTIDWGDGSEPTAGKVVNLGFGVFAVAGKHTCATNGRFKITISVVDDGGSTKRIATSALVLPNLFPF